MAIRKQPRRWIEFALIPYPDTGTLTYRWATRPYAAEFFVEGRMPVDGWQAIERAASSMSGEPHIDSAAVVLNDADGLFRDLLGDPTTQWFLNRFTALRLLSEAGWNAELQARIVFSGKCSDAQVLDERKARLEFEDILGPYLDKTYPQYTLGDAYPYRFTELEDVDEDLNTEDPGLQIPTQLRDQVMPIYYGPFVDTETNPVTGELRQKGMIPTYFMGYTHLTAGTGEVGEPTPEQAALMEPFEISEGWGGWGELFVALGEQQIPNVYTSNLGDPPRRILNDADYGVTILAPGHPGWPFDTDYVMRNGFRVTVIYARGPLLWQHITNVVNITVDVCGWPSPESPGAPIDQAGYAFQDFISQHVLANGGAGYTSGPSIATVPDYGTSIPPNALNDRAMFWTSKIQDWQAMTAQRLGTDKGYLISMALTRPTPLREIIRTFHTSFDSFDAKNSSGQLYLFSIDDLADPADGVAIRERIELRRLPAAVIDWNSIENQIDYTYGWDPEQDRPRTVTQTIRDEPSIAAMRDTRTVRDSIRKGKLDLKYTSDDATAIDVVGRRLMRHREPPHYQPLPLRTDGIDREIGEHVRVSHRDGFGSPGVGYLDRPMVILRHTYAGHDITLVALDVERILTQAARFADDTVPVFDEATESERLELGFWTDDDGNIPSDNVRGSEWR